MSLKNYLKKNNISNYMLSKKSDVAESTISQFINNKRGITLETACKLADALGITLDKFRELTRGEGRRD